MITVDMENLKNKEGAEEKRPTTAKEDVSSRGPSGMEALTTQIKEQDDYKDGTY